MSITFSSKKAGGTKKTPGCFAIGWILFSSLFVIAGLGISFKQAQLWTWEEAPCEILEFQIKDNVNQDEPFTANVRFRFQHQGQEFTSSKLAGSETDYAKYEDLVEIDREVQRRGTCYFDPNKPEEAILKRGSGGIWSGLAFAIFGGVFVLIGVTMLRSSKASSKAISSKSKDDSNGGPIGFIFFAIFALAGVAMLFAITVPTAKKYFAAKTWETVEATVIWSKVRSHSSDDGTTYSPDVFYRYRFQGEEFRSNSFSLSSGSSSGRDKKQSIVDSYPRGHKFTSYVNPRKPWQALVQPKLGWWALFGLFPLPFLAIGVGGLWWTLKNSKKPAQGTRSTAAHMPVRSGIHDPATPAPQKPKAGSRWGKFFGHLFFATFWCGIVSIFVTVAWGGWSKGEPEWFLIIFLIPFVLIGLVLAGTLPHSFLAIFSPQFDFDLRDEDLKPGLATKLRWKQTGGNGLLTEMTITLEGREQATYQQGTNRSTSTSLFYQKELFQSKHLPEMLANECDLIFPADAVPTFVGDHNCILWSLRMHGAVKNRPDVKEEIALTLQPLNENDFR